MEKALAILAWFGVLLWIPFAVWEWGWPAAGLWWLGALVGAGVAIGFGRHLLALTILLSGTLIAHSLLHLGFMYWGQPPWWCWSSFAILCLG